MIREVSIRLALFAAVIVAVASCVDNGRRLAAWWDGYDFSSLDSFSDIREAENRFEGYVKLLDEAPHDMAAASLMQFMDSASVQPVAYTIWSEWFEVYLHSLQSPYRNEDLFRLWLDRVISDRILDPMLMEHLEKIDAVSDKNLEGMKVTDVMLEDSGGGRFRLSEMAGTSCLVYLLDANCSSCVELMGTAADEYEGEDVRLLAVLVNGNPVAADRIAASSVPEWTVTYCPGREIEDWKVFDLSLMPARLLVGPDGMVERSYH